MLAKAALGQAVCDNVMWQQAWSVLATSLLFNFTGRMEDGVHGHHGLCKVACVSEDFCEAFSGTCCVQARARIAGDFQAAEGLPASLIFYNSPTVVCKPRWRYLVGGPGYS